MVIEKNSMVGDRIGKRGNGQLLHVRNGPSAAGQPCDIIHLYTENSGCAMKIDLWRVIEAIPETSNMVKAVWVMQSLYMRGQDAGQARW